MFYFLLTLLVLDAILLTTVVLLQAGKGGGLAAMGSAGAGAESLFGSRHAATLLTKATWWTGGIFLVLAFVLSMMTGRVGQPESVLQGLQGPAPAAAPAIPGTVQPAAPAGGTTTPEAPAGEAPAAPVPGQPQGQ